MDKIDKAKQILKLAKKDKVIYHYQLREAQLALGRKKVNDFVKNNEIKIVIKF